jgi:hypothetical protein
MKKLMVIILITLFWYPSLHAKAAPICQSDPRNQSIFRVAADSSNYKISVIKTDIKYTEIRFTIVDSHESPLAAIVWLNDLNKKAISSVYGNNDGKVIIMLYTDTIQNLIVGEMGYGLVSIPVKDIKYKVTDISVKLYPYVFID